MSALPPKADICSAANSSLFDHLVGAGEYCRRYCEAQRLGGFQIYNQFIPSGLLHWQVRRLFALENAANINASLPVGVGDTCSVADQTSGSDRIARFIDCGQSMARRQSNEGAAMTVKEGIVMRDKETDMLPRSSRKRQLEVGLIRNIKKQ